MTTAREELVFADRIRRYPRSRVDLAARTSRLLVLARRTGNSRRTRRGPYRAKRASASSPRSQRRNLGHRSDSVQPHSPHPAVRAGRHHLVPKRRAGLQASQGINRRRSLHYSRPQAHGPPRCVRLRLIVTADSWEAQYRPEGEDQFHTADQGELPPPGDDQVSIQCYNGPEKRRALDPLSGLSDQAPLLAKPVVIQPQRPILQRQLHPFPTLR